MKFLIVLSVAVACVFADVSHLDAAAPIVKSSYDQTPEGNFQYAYETGNGIYAQASGVLTNPNGEYPSIAIQGAYKYTAPDGTPVEFEYTADEGGYKPVSNSLPVGPPIPDLIAKSLAYIAAHPPPAAQPQTFAPKPYQG